MSQGAGISHQMEYLLATGNLVSRSGLGLMQVNDYEDFFFMYFNEITSFSTTLQQF